MSVSLVSQLQAEIADAQQQAINYQNAAHINHQKWQEEVKARQLESLDAAAAKYRCSGDDLRKLVDGFGKLTCVGLTLRDVVDALCEKFPQHCEGIRAAFGLE